MTKYKTTQMNPISYPIDSPVIWLPRAKLHFLPDFESVRSELENQT